MLHLWVGEIGPTLLETNRIESTDDQQVANTRIAPRYRRLEAYSASIALLGCGSTGTFLLLGLLLRATKAHCAEQTQRKLGGSHDKGRWGGQVMASRW